MTVIAKHAWARWAAKLVLLTAACAGTNTHTAWGQDAAGGNRGAPSATSIDPAGGAAAAENPCPIDFATALATVSRDNPQVAFANARIREAFAQWRGARALWLPSIRPGVSYNKHEGPLQGTDGLVIDSSRSSLEAGLGTQAIGSGSPAVPGVTANFRLADAIFLPRIAGHEVAARQELAAATAHDVLLFVAVAYLDLLRAFQLEAIARETFQHTEQLAEITAAFARAGQGSQADADRARAELAVRQNAVAQATEQARVASARLVELLNMEPTRVLVPREANLVPIDLVSRDPSVAQLVAQGLARRPELAESRHLVAEAVHRLERERCAPLIPSVLLGISQSGYGGGPGDAVTHFRGRFDLDATAYWEIRSLGVGELAARQEARARLEQARLRQVQLMDRVAREIVEARAQVESRRGQMAVAQSGIRAATDSFQKNMQRVRGGQGLPLEALQSIQALDLNRREYLRTVGDYDEAQFRLYRAMGCPIPSGAGPAEP